jgi:starch synthase
MVSRMVEQKGIDLLIEALPALFEPPLQIVVLGTGDARYEQALRALAKQNPERLAVLVGYDEALAHRIIGGADLFLMPSRFEPCGLTQLYSLRYGTVPVVHGVGGLVDTVIDATPAALATGTATGIVFDGARPATLAAAVDRALRLYDDQSTWTTLRRAGMRQDFAWRQSAGEYQRLYDTLIPRPAL